MATTRVRSVSVGCTVVTRERTNTIVNDVDESNLARALREQSYLKTKFFLECASDKENMWVKQNAILFLAGQKEVQATQKVYLLDFDARLPHNLPNKQDFSEQIIQTIIKVTTSPEDLHQFIQTLDEREKQNPYLQPCLLPQDRYAGREWNGQAVSQRWAQLIDCAKTQIRALCQKSGYDSQVFTFLSSPTHKRSFIFPTVNNPGNITAPLLKEEKQQQNCCCLLQ